MNLMRRSDTSEGALTDKVTPLKRWVDMHVGEGKTFTSNQALADAAHVGESTIRNIRAGHGIRESTFDKLAAAFGLPPHQLKLKLDELEDDPHVRSALADTVMSIYRRLPEPLREQFVKYGQFLLEEGNDTKK